MFQGLEERDLFAHGGDIVKSEHRQHEIIGPRHELTKDTLLSHLDIISSNARLVNENHQDVYQAAEMIRSVFDQLFTTELDLRHDVSWQFVTHLMVFGAYESWLYAYLMTSAGLYDIGYMAIRRAIEFVCYIAKVYNSDERSDLWQLQTSDEEARKKFAAPFAIPGAYQCKKYQHLQQILDAYELATNYAAHANFEMISGKWQDMKNSKKLVLSFQDKPDTIPLSLGYIMLVGYRMIQSLNHQLSNHIKAGEGYNDSSTALAEMVRQARLQLAGIEYKGKTPKDVIESINRDELLP